MSRGILSFSILIVLAALQLSLLNPVSATPHGHVVLLSSLSAPLSSGMSSLAVLTGRPLHLPGSSVHEKVGVSLLPGSHPTQKPFVPLQCSLRSALTKFFVVGYLVSISGLQAGWSSPQPVSSAVVSEEHHRQYVNVRFCCVVMKF